MTKNINNFLMLLYNTLHLKIKLPPHWSKDSVINTVKVWAGNINLLITRVKIICVNMA